MTFLKPMTRARFRVLAGLALQFDPSVFGREVGWYESIDGTLVAVLMLDTDDLYSVSLLGRDLAGRYRWVWRTDEFTTPGPALGAAAVFAAGGYTHHVRVYPQDDEGKPLDLFTHVVAPDKLHPRFALLDSGEHYVAARAVVQELMPWFENQDGNFVQQFQSDGFDARIWELYLFMMLREAGLRVSFPKPAPDFLASGPDGQFFLEATTANPVQGGSAPARPSTPDEAAQHMEGFVVSRYSGPLLAKLAKRYWEDPKVQGFPLAIAIQDFHDELSMTYSGNALQIYLYGHAIDVAEDGTTTVRKVEEHRWGTKVFPSGFFFLPDAENISAVLFNGSGTMSKFNRIGIGAGFGSPHVSVLHSGRRLDPALPGGGAMFSTEITGGYEEEWMEGMNVLHNPRATHPLDPSLLPGAAHHFWDGARYIATIPVGHLDQSITHNVLGVPAAE